MGRLQYETKTIFDVDDRELARLRVVVMNKLRRGESFKLQVPDLGHGYCSIWLHPAVPLMFKLYGSRPPKLDHAIIQEWLTQGSSPEGLSLTTRG